jgi:regulator of RNase E activity RraA
MAQAVINEFLNLSIPNISDALDVLELNGALAGIRLINRISPRLVIGQAYTVQFEPVAAGTPAPAADYIDDVSAGAVIVLANGGRLDCTVWGHILTRCAKLRRVQATVIDGCCRDIEAIRSEDYPVFARDLYMQSGKNRTRMTARQIPVEINRVLINPGDLICGDENGVVVLPQSDVHLVLHWARKAQVAEAQILEHLAAGGTLKEARRKFNYNRFAVGARSNEHL